jgi:hypothetical protein
MERFSSGMKVDEIKRIVMKALHGSFNLLREKKET